MDFYKGSHLYSATQNVDKIVCRYARLADANFLGRLVHRCRRRRLNAVTNLAPYGQSEIAHSVRGLAIGIQIAMAAGAGIDPGQHLAMRFLIMPKARPNELHIPCDRVTAQTL